MAEECFEDLDAVAGFILLSLTLSRGCSRAMRRRICISAPASRHRRPLRLASLRVLRFARCQRMQFFILQRHLSLNRGNLRSQGFTLGLDFQMPALCVLAPV